MWCIVLPMILVVSESSIIPALKQLLLDRCERGWLKGGHRTEPDNMLCELTFAAEFQKGGHWSLLIFGELSFHSELAVDITSTPCLV